MSGEEEKKNLKKFFRSSENRVIIEGFADRSEVKREAGCESKDAKRGDR
jgi:hypothetical protein